MYCNARFSLLSIHFSEVYHAPKHRREHIKSKRLELYFIDEFLAFWSEIQWKSTPVEQSNRWKCSSVFDVSWLFNSKYSTRLPFWQSQADWNDFLFARSGIYTKTLAKKHTNRMVIQLNYVGYLLLHTTKSIIINQQHAESLHVSF